MRKIEVQRIPKLAKIPFIVSPFALLGRLFSNIFQFFQRIFAPQNAN
jgi:hypothetical protein